MANKVDQMVIFLFDQIIPVHQIEPNMRTYIIWQKLIDLSLNYNQDAVHQFFKIKTRYSTDSLRDHVWRMMQRLRQIEHGKKTNGYRNFMLTVPFEERSSEMYPQTPNIFQDLPKRKWHRMMSAWRVQLHRFDDDELAMNVTSDDDEVIVC